MRKEYYLEKAFPETLTNQFDFSTSYVDQEGETHNYTIFDTTFFTNEISRNFATRQILLDKDDPSTDLVSLFTIWKNSRADAYARRAYALAQKYEPLFNYDRTEHKEGSNETTHGETITRTHNNTDTETHTDTDTLTYAGSETTDNGIFGVNSSVSVPSDTATKSFTNRTDTNAHTGAITDSHTGTITDAHSGKDSGKDDYDLRAYGNIGVTTSAAMLEEDFKLLKVDLALAAVFDFLDRYTYYTEVVDL